MRYTQRMRRVDSAPGDQGDHPADRQRVHSHDQRHRVGELSRESLSPRRRSFAVPSWWDKQTSRCWRRCYWRQVSIGA